MQHFRAVDLAARKLENGSASRAARRNVPRGFFIAADITSRGKPVPGPSAHAYKRADPGTVPTTRQEHRSRGPLPLSVPFRPLRSVQQLGDQPQENAKKAFVY
jgi:hypothetical protein